MRMRVGLSMLLLPLAACQPGAAPVNEDTAATRTTPAVSTPSFPANQSSAEPSTITASPAQASAEPVQSCEARIGATAAAALARQCRAVSPATRPPCNAANSCALIRDETARGCAMLDAAAAKTAGCVDPEDAEAAVAAVERYYDAIDARDYGTAYALWGGYGKASGQSAEGFAKGFADTRSVRVTPGKPGLVEGAAGSRYVTVPVTVNSVLRDGTRQRFTGEYHLRRVAPIQGATANDRRWHLDSADLRKG